MLILFKINLSWETKVCNGFFVYLGNTSTMRYASVKLLLLTAGYMILCSLTGMGAQDEAPFFRHSLSLKPVNFSCIDLSGSNRIPGYHVGAQYERRIDKSGHWTIVLPVTATDLRYRLVYEADYSRSGYAVYITPGVRYYVNTFNRVSGYSAGLNLLAGVYNYQYSTELSSGKAESIFGGILFNNYYALKLWKSWSVQAELGAGVRNTRKDRSYIIREANGVIDRQGNEKISRYTAILNTSLGVSYRF